MAHNYKRHEGMGKRHGASGAEMHKEGSYGASEDHSKNAGVPTEVKITMLSKNNSDYLTERYDDTIKGIDARLAQGASKLRGKFSADGRKC